jgi:iron only hydrogenase large subunit-like protein
LSQVSKAPTAQTLIGQFLGKDGAASFLPCLAQKYEVKNGEKEGRSVFALTTRELIRLFKMISFDLSKLPESELILPPLPERESGGDTSDLSGLLPLARAIYSLQRLGESRRPFSQHNKSSGIYETLVEMPDGTNLSFILVYGMAAAGRILEEMALGHKGPAFVKIMSCPQGCSLGGGQAFASLQRTWEGIGSLDDSPLPPLVPVTALPWETEVLSAFKGLKLQDK